MTAAEFFAANRAIQWYLDEPMPNPAEVPLYFLCKTARQRVKVVLSGEGADELFGGYPLYRQAVWAERWQALPRSLRRGLAAALPGAAFCAGVPSPGGSAAPGLTMCLKLRRNATNI